MKPIGIAESGQKHIFVLFKRFITEWAWDGRILCKWADDDLLDANCITTDTQGKQPLKINEDHCHKVMVFKEFLQCGHIRFQVI